MCWLGEKGPQGDCGMTGPSSITYFEIRHGGWNEKYAVLQALCFGVQKFLLENPEIARKIEITQFNIKSYLSPNK